MASITELLSNIKTLLRKKYYLKEDEDIGLFIEDLFEYCNGQVLFDNKLKMTVTGSSFSSYSSTPFTYTGKILIDWGDGITEQYTGGRLSHTFVDNVNTHEISISGEITSLGEQCFQYIGLLTSITLIDSITSLGNNCFSSCLNLAPIELPNSITSLGGMCFSNCSSLNPLILNWVTSDTIITYADRSSVSWAYGFNGRFSIPSGTRALYIAKNYPSDRLDERSA